MSSPLVEHFNGTSWSIQTTPATGGTLNAVTAISPTDVWAVGGTGSADLVENFNGTTWSVVQVPSPGTSDPSLGGISAVSSTDIFAIGGNGKGNFPQVLQFNGTTWTSLPNLPTGIAVTAIDAISATDVWTVGDGNIWNFNGTNWTEVASGIERRPVRHLGLLGQRSLRRRRDHRDHGRDARRAVERHDLERRHQRGRGELTGVTTLSNGTAVAVGAVGIESNATTAAPESRVSGVHPDGTVAPPATSPVQVPGSECHCAPPATAPFSPGQRRGSRAVRGRPRPGGDNTARGVTTLGDGTAVGGPRRHPGRRIFEMN